MHASPEERLLSSDTAVQGVQSPRMGGGELVPMVRKLGPWILHYTKFLLCLGLFWTADFLLAWLLRVSHISFPSSLVGLFLVLATLVGLELLVSTTAADAVVQYVSPVLAWVQCWMPLFYAPLLVPLPLTLRHVSGVDLLRILVVIALGMPATLLVTGHCVLGIRHMTGRELQPQPRPPPTLPFTRVHSIVWGSIGCAALISGMLVSETLQRFTDTVLMLSATCTGFLFGAAMPAVVQRWLHPVISCALAANAAALWLGVLRGTGYYEQLRLYHGQGDEAIGGGDLLLSFLGVVVLSFGFRIFQQRRVMIRHAPEVLGGALASSLFSLFGTATAARAVGLQPGLARALVPRSVTAALAVPIARALGADTTLTAAAVVLTGVLGANVAKTLLDRSSVNDPIARGLSTAASSHGIGTAALVAEEPDTLPFCGLAYALVGVMSTLLMSIPLLQTAIQLIAA